MIKKYAAYNLWANKIIVEFLHPKASFLLLDTNKKGSNLRLNLFAFISGEIGIIS
jgi:hypothetical protein